jgi:adenine deaminase
MENGTAATTRMAGGRKSIQGRAGVPHGTGTAVGTNDADIRSAIQALEELQGGQAAVQDGKVKAHLGLPIAGLVSDQPLEEMIRRLHGLNAAARVLGCERAAPFMTFSFLSRSPIPELKLTDQGLIDAARMRQTSLFCQ